MPPEIDMKSESIVIDMDPRWILMSSEMSSPLNITYSATPFAITTLMTKITSRRMSTANTKGTIDLTMARIMRRKLLMTGTNRKKLNTRKERKMPVMRTTRRKLRSTRKPTRISSATLESVSRESNMFQAASSPTKNSPSEASIRRQISSTKVVVNKSSPPSSEE